MSNQQINIGDFVAIKGASKPLVGVVIKERQSWSGRRNGLGIHPSTREKIKLNPTPNVLRIRFGEWSDDLYFEEECRKLTGKEIFKAKLADDWDYFLRHDDIDINSQ